MTTQWRKDAVHPVGGRPAKSAKDSGPRVQLKSSVAGLHPKVQLERLRPTKPLQLAAGGGGGGADERSVQAVASEGMQGSGRPLPFLETVQGAFGSHDVSQVQAYTSSEARTANERLGSQAYASGERVAFKSEPTLHTVAHEAAHVVQQRAGVSLEGGVGRSGDVYERHADSVAAAVVQGKSAEGLLDRFAGRSGGAAVQREGDGEDDVVLPEAVPAMGQLTYYQERKADFDGRYAHRDDLKSPSYYMAYGDKYLHRFVVELRPELSAEGQVWLDQAAVNLQLAIEDEVVGDPEGFDALEKDDPAFTAFAYGTHADAYWNAGLGDLNLFDLAKIGLTPDVKDLVTQAGLEQVADIGIRILGRWGNKAIDYVFGDGSTEELIDFLYQAYGLVGYGIDKIFGDGTTDWLVQQAGELKKTLYNWWDAGYDILADKVSFLVRAVDSVFGKGTVNSIAEKARTTGQKLVSAAERGYNWAKEKLSALKFW